MSNACVLNERMNESPICKLIEGKLKLYLR